MTKTPSNDTIFLTVKQVAARYGTSTDTIWRWKREDRLPAAVRVGPNSTRWRLSDLLKYDSTLQSSFATHIDWLIPS